MTHRKAARKRKPIWIRLPIYFSLAFVSVAVLILALQIYINGFWENVRCKGERGFLCKLQCGIAATYEDDAPYFRLLPTDEEMIAHFQKHRTDFERLVQIYREDPSLPNRWGMVDYHELHPKEQAIMARVGVNGMRGDWQSWVPPDPYSVEAQKQVATLGLFREAQKGTSEGRKFSGVILSYAHPPVIRLNADLAWVFKGYYYTPLVPKIENGRLKKPDGGERIFPTLNTYPSWLICGNCVLKQFEPQWFIRLCQGCK
ncbi:MAG: hypothetical protein FJ118_17545 [Deltaproteobacteria bacterium]|nr:hypothetical protein [Deltaproteobacteria bacterium]